METPSLEHLIVNSIFTDENYMRKVLPFIQLDYFSSPYKDLFKIFVSYVTKYNDLPTREAYIVSLEEAPINLTTQNEDTRNTVNDLFTKRDLAEQWLLDNSFVAALAVALTTGFHGMADTSCPG